MCKKHNHLGVVERYSNGRCVLCRRAAARSSSALRRETVPEIVKASNLAWRERNREPLRARARSRYTGENKEKVKARAKQWRIDNPERFREQGWKAKGIVWAVGQTFESVWSQQDGRCANEECHRDLSSLPSKHVHVDHDHEKHAVPNVRGILCHKCNLGIGFLNSPELLRGAAKYMEGLKNSVKQKC